MEFEEEGIVLAARTFGETGAIVEVLTASKGKWAAHVPGGASRRLRPVLQPGVRGLFRYRARLDDQLGSGRLDPSGEGPSALFEDPLALAGLESAAAVLDGALPEREPHPGVFAAFAGLLSAFADAHVWPAAYVRFEAGLLAELGFGLDLTACAATGRTDELIYVSPRTGRAVSAVAGAPYKDRLLGLPRFLLSTQERLVRGDIAAGLRLTGHFLEAFVFAAVDRPLPPARVRLARRLQGDEGHGVGGSSD